MGLATKILARLGWAAPAVAAAAALAPWFAAGGRGAAASAAVLVGAALVAGEALRRRFGRWPAALGVAAFVLTPPLLWGAGRGSWMTMLPAALVFVGAAYGTAGKGKWWSGALWVLGGAFAVYDYATGRYAGGAISPEAVARNLTGVWQLLLVVTPAFFPACVAAGFAAARLGRRDAALSFVAAGVVLAAGLVWDRPATTAFDYLARFTPAAGIWATVLAAGAADRGRAAAVAATVVVALFSLAVFLLGAVAAGVLDFKLALTVGPPTFLGNF